jgi:hypothetical protein
MVVITLDEIIPYHPPPKFPSKLPSKPSRSYGSVSSGECPSLRAPLPLTHPLPPRPLQIPSLVMPCLHSCSSGPVDPSSIPNSGVGEQAVQVMPANQNAFDRELAKFDLVEVKDATAVDTYIDDGDLWQDDCVDDIPGEEPDSPCHGKWSYHFSDLCCYGVVGTS